MSGCTLVDFDILIKGERAPYAVTVFYSGYSANGEFAPDILDPAWHQAFHTLAQTMSFGDTDAIMAIGSHLWQALMQGNVRDLWVAARADVEQGRVDGLRMRLDLQPPHVSALPWESLYDPDRNIIFAAHPHFALVRVASLYKHVGPYRRPQVQRPLRVLIAAPDDPSGMIDSRREIAEIRQIMSNLSANYTGTDFVQVEELTGQFTITDLRTKLAKVKPTILHFIGHGDPNGLFLWQRGRHTLTPAQSLRSVMERSYSLKLAFLNSCLAGRPARPRPFAGVAEQMMQAGIPAVIAMQYMIRDDVAIDFAHFLYEELLGGACPGIIDLAMSAARSGLYASNPGDFSFGTPVLWLNRNGGCIFSLDHPASDSSASALEEMPAPAKASSLDLQEESEWIDNMVASTDISQLSGELAFLRSKWINYIEELRSLLLQLSALAEQTDSPVYEEKVADYRRFKAALLRVKRLIEDANRQA
jgi:hypothetical protein